MLFTSACASTSNDEAGSEPSETSSQESPTTTTAPRPTTTTTPPPPAPESPTGDLSAETTAALDTLWDNLGQNVSPVHIEAVGATDDPRVAWLLSDLMRFTGPATNNTARLAIANVTDTSFEDALGWQATTNRLMSWDLPSFPGYVEYKRRLFTLVEPKWDPFFEEGSDIDYRILSWGGVRIDDRPLDDTEPCDQGCIPALDHPAVTDASLGDWYPDDALVFGVEINGESRAYPKNIMEVHEMTNDTLGGRDFALPYCTLCGSAQAYFTDEMPEGIEQPVLRTSGLLSRSNKVMYDLNTFSVFDTFRGNAVSGPLLEAGIVLPQVTVVTATWKEWREDHPDTTIIKEDGGIGRHYPLDPLRGRDDDGPIFPIGDADPRLGVQDQIVGVLLEDGTAIAFPAAAARAAVKEAPVEFSGVRLIEDSGGIRVELDDGTEVVSHQSFWFAWSQFYPETLLWLPEG